MKVTINKDPDLDFFIGRLGGFEIPTKQDKFKPMLGYEFFTTEKDGVKEKVTDLDFYTKKKSENTLKKFEEDFTQLIKENLKEEHPYKKPEKLEVIISVSMDEKRLESVDIDNLAKAILDCFNGLVYEDDSQIVSLLAFKEINGFYPVNGLMVGIKRLEKKKKLG